MRSFGVAPKEFLWAGALRVFRLRHKARIPRRSVGPAFGHGVSGPPDPARAPSHIRDTRSVAPSPQEARATGLGSDLGAYEVPEFLWTWTKSTAVPDWRSPIMRPAACSKRSNRSAFTNLKFGFRREGEIHSRRPKERLSYPVTVCPSDRSRSTRWLPMKPAAPVTKYLAFGASIIDTPLGPCCVRE